MKRSIDLIVLVFCIGLLFQLTVFFSGCSSKQQPVSDFPTNGNVLRQDQAVWTPDYLLPTGWESDSQQKNLLRHQVAAGWPESLEFYYLGQADLLSPIKDLRDQAYERVFCQDQALQSFVNCQKGFTKFSLTIKGLAAEGFRYYGNWQDQQREVNEIFLNQNGKILHFSAEGDWQKIEPVLGDLLQTLQWSLEVPSLKTDLSPELKGL